MIIDALRAEPFDEIAVDVVGPLSNDFSIERFIGVPGLRYLGVVPSEDVGGLIAEYEALVLPTSYKGEGYPGVIIEAYLQGTPVITTYWRSIPEIVIDRGTGLLIPPNDAPALVEAMKTILFDRKLAHQMRKSSLDFAKSFSSSYWHGEKWDEWLVTIDRG